MSDVDDGIDAELLKISIAEMVGFVDRGIQRLCCDKLRAGLLHQIPG